MRPERYNSLKAVLKRRQPDLTVLMEGVHKPHNLAAIIRTADATGLYRVHAVGDKEITRRKPKAASGAKRWVKVSMHDSTNDALDTIRGQGMKVVAAHPGEGSVPYNDYDFTQPVAIVLGSELIGLSDEAKALADDLIHVPMQGFTESLNVSVTGALILYQAMQQRLAAGLYDHCRIDEATFKRTLFEWAFPRLAHYCRDKGLDYPNYDLETGELLDVIPGSASAPFK